VCSSDLKKVQLLEKNDIRELSFNKLDESFAHIRSVHLHDDINIQRKQTNINAFDGDINVKINPSQRLFDVYPSGLFEKNDTDYRPPSTSAKRTENDTIFPHFLSKNGIFYEEQSVNKNKNTRLLSSPSDRESCVENAVNEREAASARERFKTRFMHEKTDSGDSQKKSNDYSERNLGSTKIHYTDKSFRNSVFGSEFFDKIKSISKNNRKNEKYDDDTVDDVNISTGDINQNKISHNEFEANNRLDNDDSAFRKKNASNVKTRNNVSVEREYDLYRERDFRFLFKITISGIVLVFCSLILLWIGQQNKSANDDDIDEVVFIPSPKNIKIRPDESMKKSTVPYQDALIYGNIGYPDEDNEDVTGERLLPIDAFAPQIIFEEDKNDQENKLKCTVGDCNKEKIETSEYLSEDDNNESPTKTTNIEHPNIEKNTRVQADDINNILNRRAPTKRVPSTEIQTKKLYVQICTLTSAELAKKEAKRLRDKYRILSSCQLCIRPSRASSGQTVYRLLAGPFNSETRAKQIEQALGIR
jgi:hypothetical protein